MLSRNYIPITGASAASNGVLANSDELSMATASLLFSFFFQTQFLLTTSPESSTERNVEHSREWPCRSWRRYHCSNHHVSSQIGSYPSLLLSLSTSYSSEEDADMIDNADLDTTYLHTNGNAGHGSLPEHNNANGEHSVSGDLHGVQPDPVAADILRKEPEHETFVRLRISPFETPSSDEAEVYRALQGCLEMRKSYVYREYIAPWEKQVISDPSSPKRNPNPF
ncbi:unnamed protein product [Lactuca virosa]|uniref:Uncharacterized protein n=1 Tax=Lactuca virosa TaxID=75947 RepID=A0AAU9NFS2_9ASTR|nr:unnamed protein product [Lactuca virosa]